jgi:heat shock protein HslJ
MASPRSLALVLLVLGVLGSPGIARAQSGDAVPSPVLAAAPSDPAAQTELPPFEGTAWRLTHLRQPSQGSLMEVRPDVAAWMRLIGGRLEGSTGCAALSGTFGRIGQELRIRPDPAPGGSCRRGADAIARGMASGLVRATDVAIVERPDGSAAELLLLDADGAEMLRFAPDDVGSLVDGPWELASFTIDGQTALAVPGRMAVLEFGDDGGSVLQRRARGPLVGSSGCNGIVATFERQADVLRIRDVESTGAPCTSDLAVQETAMLSVLGTAELRLSLPPDRLVLRDPVTGDGLDLVTSTPLEGSTWLLAEIPGLGPVRGPVTLRLQDGLLSGEGPCGPYQGRYTTDGRLIRFQELRGAGIQRCTDREAQRKLLLALGRAVVLDRDQPQLRLRDAAGMLVARFRRPPGP